MYIYEKNRIWNVIKWSFNNAVNTSETPVTAHLYQVKKGDRGENYKKKLSWLLRDLRCIDGKSAEKVGQ